MRRVLIHVRGRLARGLFLVLPLLITVWLLGLLFDIIDANVTPFVMAVLRRAQVPGLELWPTRVLATVVGLLLTGTSIYLIGLLAGNLAGQRVLRWIERGILRIPLVKGIYGAARQLLDAFSMTGTRAFSKVVIVEYPRKGLWTVGFVTTERELGRSPEGRPFRDPVPVFLPTTPNPTSGWMLLVEREDLMVVDITIEEAVKLIVSGGIVGPGDLVQRIRSWEPESR